MSGNVNAQTTEAKLIVRKQFICLVFFFFCRSTVTETKTKPVFFSDAVHIKKSDIEPSVVIKYGVCGKFT